VIYSTVVGGTGGGLP